MQTFPQKKNMDNAKRQNVDSEENGKYKEKMGVSTVLMGERKSKK